MFEDVINDHRDGVGHGHDGLLVSLPNPGDFAEFLKLG
jgi:hypothetical protein